MTIEIARPELATVAGIALFVAVILEIAVKPVLNAAGWGKVVPETDPPQEQAPRRWYRVALNGSALVLGLVGGIAGGYINNVLGNPQDVLFSLFQGVFGAFAAVFGYEVFKSLRIFTAGQGA